MDRLSGLDASFLYLETPEQLMHVCGLIVLDPETVPGGYTFSAMRDLLDSRVKKVDQFTRKVRRVPLDVGHPVWVRDDHFDINHHFHRMALPQPAGYAELMEICGHLAGQPMNRSRPLWEMVLIEGYHDVDGVEKLVVFSKMHHATVDGASGSNLISYLCSLEPDAPPLAPDDPPKASRAPGGLELLGRGVVETLMRPLGIPKLVPSSIGMIAQSIDRARQGTAMAAPLTAPRTSFNGTINGHRTIAIADMKLEDIKEVRRATGATVNDIVLSIAGGALRSYLDERGELPNEPLLASVPVSVREDSSRDVGANKVSSLFARLGTDIDDPLERLRQMTEDNRNAKEHNKAISADMLQDWAEFAAPRVFGLAVRAYAGLRLAEKHPVVHNLVISNVPGPPVPLYFLGAQVLGMYPLGPVFHGAGLNITVLSNNGVVHVGIIACEESVRNPQTMVEHFPRELERLKAEVAVGGAAHS
ncbi:wax ester/triacylglycerol synthase family O-acyltransferase [Gordonia sp. HY442]|uniref:WS/DGAT/MGAT family O-acyltransferase n=1 Tax=Gordonia zhenghanii TaxID=2911516 RepID=UPI001F283106|nr:wax ester/triacylglycerol synthase family O-acyltransferase [Gordonia zhenghanii]MCF8607842.1 wax ester/triacylglycerol synthase family O-acyltransferase [Gordonia zhenghanii]